MWSPSPINFIKCNVDVAIFPNVAGYGVVLRDAGGNFVEAKKWTLECGPDPYFAEVMAAKEALAWLKDRGGGNFILEFDCLIIKQCRVIANRIGNVLVVLVRHVRRNKAYNQQLVPQFIIRPDERAKPQNVFHAIHRFSQRLSV
nr:uncharacterized protein LOC109179181 [Ipomoea batatas]